jgi:hypothetical protein
VVDFIKFIKAKKWFFLLFLLPATLIVNITNNLIYPLVMNSKALFQTASYFSLIIITLLLVVIYSVIESEIKNKTLRTIFKILIMITSVIAILIVLINITFYGLFTYESCGADFNKAYLQAAKEKDPSFCFNTESEVNYYLLGKGGYHCKTPNKDQLDIMRVSDEFSDSETERETFKIYSSSCIESFSDYVNDVSICQTLEVFNKNLTEEDKVYFWDRRVSECIANYAIKNNEPQTCNLILETDYPSKQATSERCIKQVARS